MTSLADPGSRDWAQPGIGRRWQIGFFYWIMRLGGRARGYHMANIVSLWYVAISPSIRRRCRFYLDRRFPGTRSPIRRFWQTYTLVRTYAQSLVDGMVTRMFGPDAVKHESPDHDKMTEIAANPGGLIVVHAHVGSWQPGMTTLPALGRNIAIVAIPGPNLTSIVDATHTRFIDPRNGLQAATEMSTTLLRGDVLAMMGDREFGSDENSVCVPFLGVEAKLPVAPYRLASATVTPVIVMTGPKVRPGVYQLRLAKVIRVPPKLGRDPQAYRPYARQFAEAIEGFVQEFPYQFYNFYDLWADDTAGDTAAAS